MRKQGVNQISLINIKLFFFLIQTWLLPVAKTSPDSHKYKQCEFPTETCLILVSSFNSNGACINWLCSNSGVPNMPHLFKPKNKTVPLLVNKAVAWGPAETCVIMAEIGICWGSKWESVEPRHNLPFLRGEWIFKSKQGERTCQHQSCM